MDNQYQKNECIEERCNMSSSDSDIDFFTYQVADELEYLDENDVFVTYNDTQKVTLPVPTESDDEGGQYDNSEKEIESEQDIHIDTHAILNNNNNEKEQDIPDVKLSNIDIILLDSDEHDRSAVDGYMSSSDDMVVLEEPEPSQRTRKRPRSPFILLPQTSKISGITSSPNKGSDNENHNGKDKDDFFRAIERGAKRTPSVSKSITPEVLARTYLITFTSKLDGSIEKNFQTKVQGKQQFSQILPSILKSLISRFRIANTLKEKYQPENVTLYWNNSKLLNFMTCNSLRVALIFEGEISEVNITIVSKDYEIKFEEEMRQKLIEEEERLKNKADSTPNDSREPTAEFEEFENELKNVTQTVDDNELSYIEDNNQDNADVGKEVIKIALVGQDNKKVFVNVHNSTPFGKLAEYYLSQKKLSKNSKVKLMFDHDELDPTSIVEEYDMETDDMIEIFIE